MFVERMFVLLVNILVEGGFDNSVDRGDVFIVIFTLTLKIGYCVRRRICFFYLVLLKRIVLFLSFLISYVKVFNVR